MKINKSNIFVIGSIIFLIAAIIITFNIPIRKTPLLMENYKAIDDEELVNKYTPVFYVKSVKPVALYYRTSTDKAGNEYIVYHLIFDKNVYDASGIKGAFNKYIYYEGLSLRNFVVGKNDIKMIYMKFNKDKVLKEIKYDLNDKQMVLTGDFIAPLYFKVSEKDHNVDYLEKDDNDEIKVEAGYTPFDVGVTYFTNKLWQDYGMFKKKETVLKQSRPHYFFERKGVR